MKIDEIYTLPSRDEYPESYQWHFDKIDYEETLRTGLILKVVKTSNDMHIGVFDQNKMISYVGLHATKYNIWQVDMQCTDIAYRGQGYIRRSIEYAIQQYGCIMSDRGQTDDAKKVWTALIKYPNLYHYYFYNLKSNEKIKLSVVNNSVVPNLWNEDRNCVILVCDRILTEDDKRSMLEREQWEIKMRRRDRWLGPDFTDFNP